MTSFAQHIADQEAITAEWEDTHCRICDEEYEDGGDGWDGMCPTCADKAEKTGDAIERAQTIMLDTINHPEDSNTRRAARALLCVWPSYDDDTLETGLSDLMTDIRHLCDLAGFDFYAIERQGKRGYDDERHACGLAEDAALAAAIKEDLA
jgi:hypothetical protein